MLKGVRFNEFFRLMKYIKKRKWTYFTGLIGFSITEASIMLVIPIIMKFMIDAAVKKDFSYLYTGLIIAGVEIFVVCILFVYFVYIFNVSNHKTIADIRNIFFEHILKLPVSFFEKYHSGDILSRLTNDVTNIQPGIGGQLRMGVFLIITGIGSAIALFILNWKLGIILLIIGIISTLVNSLFINTIRSISFKIQNGFGKLSEKFSDSIAGVGVVKIFQIEKLKQNEFQKENDNIYDLSMKRNAISSLQESFNFLTSWINFGGIIALGSFMILKGWVEFGTIVAAMQLLINVNYMIRSLGGVTGQLQSNFSSSLRIHETIDIKTEPERYNIISSDNENSMIFLKDLKFSYENKKEALKCISINLEKGKVAALVGSSGGGKSTIIKILLGFYKPDSGNIAINGKAFEEYTLSEIRNLFSYVPQDAYIFDGTIYENICYGKPDSSYEDIDDAAKLANAKEFIDDLPEKYNTNVGERGVKLSGGQRQRIALARAILKNSPILLLDEATSSLDSQSEQLVQIGLNNVMKDRTVIVVAHRLSTIERANTIFVVDDGMIKESGSHQELLNKNGLYKKLYDAQFRE